MSLLSDSAGVTSCHVSALLPSGHSSLGSVPSSLSSVLFLLQDGLAANSNLEWLHDSKCAAPCAPKLYYSDGLSPLAYVERLQPQLVLMVLRFSTCNEVVLTVLAYSSFSRVVLRPIAPRLAPGFITSASYILRTSLIRHEQGRIIKHRCDAAPVLCAGKEPQDSG